MARYEMMKAEAYRPYAMGSMGDAAYMLIKQYRFPAEYESTQDVFITADSDRLLSWDYDGFRKVLKEHLNMGEGGIEHWVCNSDPEAVLAFIKDAFKVKETNIDVEFTGFRVLGTVNRSNGFPVYTLQLFANRSGVQEFSGGSGDNVKDSPSCVFEMRSSDLIGNDFPLKKMTKRDGIPFVVV